MQIGMIGLGRMGANMVRRLLRFGHTCVVYDRAAAAVDQLVGEGAAGAASVEEFISKLHTPRVVWLMVPAAAVDPALAELTPHLQGGDIVIDGGNSYYIDDLRRAAALAEAGIQYVDVGTSGGVWGLERGYCLMVGGPAAAVQHIDPLLKALAPGRGTIERTRRRERTSAAAGVAAGATAEEGYLHCGPNGAGHFVKMVHNGIEYGIMAAYAEGLNVLSQANVGKKTQAASPEITPLRHPEHYQYDFNLADIAEVWRRGSVIASWLLDLAATALIEDPHLAQYSGRVSDSGEGRWTAIAAIEEGVPTPVLSAALHERFTSRGSADFADKLLSALRFQFGGHHELPGTGS